MADYRQMQFWDILGESAEAVWRPRESEMSQKQREAEWQKRYDDPDRPKWQGRGTQEWDLTDNWDPEAIK
jgi:hypothetical protein